MANYLLLYHGGGMPQTDEEKEHVTGAWGAWVDMVGAQMVDAGNPTSGVKSIGRTGVIDFRPAPQ